MTQLNDLLREHSQRVPADDEVERHALDHARHTLRTAVISEPARRSRRRGRPLLAALGGIAVIAAAAIALTVGNATVNSSEAYAVVPHPDGTVTITIKEISGVSGLNERLAALGIRAKAFLADPNCTAIIQEMEPEWNTLYPKIVTENGPAPQVTIRPEAIPSNATLLLVGQHLLPGRLDVLLTLVRSPAPSCMHNVFRLATPPPPGTGLTPPNSP